MSHAFGGLRGWVNCGRSLVDASGSSFLTLQVMQIGKSSTLRRQIKLPASNRPRQHRLTAPSAPGSTSGIVGVRTYMFHGLIRPTQLMPGQSARRDHYGPIEDALERLRCGNAGSTFIAPLDAVLNFVMVSSSQVATLCCLNRFLSKPDAFQSVLGGWSWGFHAALSAALTLEMAASSVRALFMLDARNLYPSPVNRWDPFFSAQSEQQDKERFLRFCVPLIRVRRSIQIMQSINSFPNSLAHRETYSSWRCGCQCKVCLVLFEQCNS
ncbi:unnamed protein product [Polarella glacialis]|uniref:Uncharacterized protein n=1 Tax=Polarella glacialis TaxID=89957 RepID=A0A813G2Q4_POLGL|nr:unnamed protein product [Polarella glacialis]